jgi:DNA-binding XRE family transcriptional regulator
MIWIRRLDGTYHAELPVSRPPGPNETAKKPTRRAKTPAVTVPVYFGIRLKELREAAGLSQTEFAKLIGVPQPDLPAIERGERDFRLSTADRLAKALGVLLRDMLPESR